MPEIILTFELDGKTVHKETKGFTGSNCVSKSKFIEDALGGKTKNRMFKSEYYEKEKTKENRSKIRN